MLNSPLFRGDAVLTTGKCGYIEGIISGSKISAIFHVHNLCKRPVELVDWTLDDFFEKDLLPAMAERADGEQATAIAEGQKTLR